MALASAQKKCNEPQKALETLRIASQAIPSSAEIHQALGENYLAANAPTQALEAFQRAADIDPRNIPIALRLGQTLYQLGHLPQAHQVLKQAYQQEPSNIEVALTYARILMGQDDPQSALPALETVIALKPNRSGTLRRLCSSFASYPWRGSESYGSPAPRIRVDHPITLKRWLYSANPSPRKTIILLRFEPTRQPWKHPWHKILNGAPSYHTVLVVLLYTLVR